MSRSAGPNRALLRLAITGIHIVSELPREVRRTARTRAVAEGTTLSRVLGQALREYAAGMWTPRPETKVRGDV